MDILNGVQILKLKPGKTISMRGRVDWFTQVNGAKEFPNITINMEIMKDGRFITFNMIVNGENHYRADGILLLYTKTDKELYEKDAEIILN